MEGGHSLEAEYDFENIVAENQHWLLRYVHKIVGSRETAEDIVQETFLRAFKVYDGYQERGRLRQWLCVIARNVSLHYLKNPAIDREVSLCAGDEGYNWWELYSQTEPSPEEQVLANELTRQIMKAIGSIPAAQRTVVYYRFVEGFSVQQVADMTHQPVGSVKSKSHYGLQKVRGYLSLCNVEEEGTMNCKDTHAFLFQYAKDQIMPDDRAKVEEHIGVCESCRNIAGALRLLVPHIGPAEKQEKRHYIIAIPLSDNSTLSYSGMTFPMEDHERLNAILKERGGVIPPGETWFGAGHDAAFEHIAEFDNEGHRIEFDSIPNPNDPNNVRVKYKKMVRVYPEHTLASVLLQRGNHFKTTIEDPNLMIGKLNNGLGTNAKSGIYLAIPAAGRNIRIKRGNGVIDAGAFKFAFSERYVTEDETLRLECSYLKS